MEFEATKDAYRRLGADITDSMTDEQVLAAIEAWEDAPHEGPIDANERIAAALEFQNILSMEGS